MYLNDAPLPDATQSTYQPAVSGTYTVRVKWNDCESELSDEVNLIVEEYPDANIAMPNIFTPNEDGYNAVFMPIHYEYVSYAELKIVDRWGKEVFHTKDLLAGWQGNNTPSGVYYYQISYTGKNGRQGNVRGWVHLVR